MQSNAGNSTYTKHGVAITLQSPQLPELARRFTAKDATPLSDVQLKPFSSSLTKPSASQEEEKSTLKNFMQGSFRAQWGTSIGYELPSQDSGVFLYIPGYLAEGALDLHEATSCYLMIRRSVSDATEVWIRRDCTLSEEQATALKRRFPSEIFASRVDGTILSEAVGGSSEMAFKSTCLFLLPNKVGEAEGSSGEKERGPREVYDIHVRLELPESSTLASEPEATGMTAWVTWYIRAEDKQDDSKPRQTNVI